MATLEQLSTALVNADKAGDTEAAKTLANEIVRMRGQQQPSGPVQATEAAPPAVIPENPATDTFQRSMILPVGKDTATGEISPALPKVITGIPDFVQSLYESGKDAITAPGRAMNGELQVMGPDGNVSPEAIKEGLNFASWATGAAPTSAMPKAVAPVARKALTEGQEVALAGSRLGVKVPRAASSDLTAVQQMGKVTTNVPIGGTPLRKASEQAISQLDDAALRAQKGFGSGDVATAGAAARQGIKDYSANTLDDLVTKKYDVVDSLVKPDVSTPLVATKQRVSQMLAAREKAALPSEGSAAGIVKQAIDRPEGLTYDGVKRLRTEVGQMLKNPQMAPAGTSQDELRALYGSLSDDLRSVVKAAGGDKAVSAFEEANTFAAKSIEEQKALDKIVGPQSDEGLFSKIQAMAGSTSRADLQNLVRVRKAVSPETWDEVSSAVISTMGRDADGKFSPDRFLTAYGKLSQNGKGLLFKTTGKTDLASSLDDIATVSRRFKQLNQFANPSGTGQAIIGGSYIPGLFVEPTSVISGVVGTRILSSALSKPTSARKLAEWAKAYETAAVKPSTTANRMLDVRSKVLALAIANDSGFPQQVGNIVSAISRVRHSPADPGNENQRAQENQQEREDGKLRMLAPNEL